MINSKVNCLLFVCSLFFVQTLCIFLPESYEKSYDTIKLPFKDQRQAKEHNTNHLTEVSNNVVTRSQTQQLYQKEQQQLLNEKSYDKINDVDDTNNDVLIATSITAAGTVATASMNSTEKTRSKRQLSDLLIVPNTKWCGRGNAANNTYNHLGGASLADKCCRRHDNCSYFIPGLSNRYDLFNYRPYTLSHCNCDRRFHTCLKMANDDDARTIGKLFFNMVQTNCFVLRSEKVCRKRAPDGTCLEEFIKQKAYIKRNRKF